MSNQSEKNKQVSDLCAIQCELKAPKSKFNKYGNFWYRSTEDVLEALKPLLAKYGCELTITDECSDIGGVPVVRAKVLFVDSKGKEYTATSFAGIETKKGMDMSQVFGSASTYARKYALNGMFLIDDNKDADSDEYREQRNQQSRGQQQQNTQQQRNQQSRGQQQQNTQQQRNQQSRGQQQQNTQQQRNQQSRGQQQQNTQQQRNQQSRGQQQQNQQQSGQQQSGKKKRPISERFNNALALIKTTEDPSFLDLCINTFGPTQYSEAIQRACEARADQMGWVKGG